MRLPPPPRHPSYLKVKALLSEAEDEESAAKRFGATQMQRIARGKLERLHIKARLKLSRHNAMTKSASAGDVQGDIVVREAEVSRRFPLCGGSRAV